MGEKDAQLLRTYWMALFTAILLIGGGYFGYVFFTQEEKTLANDLTPLGYLGERIEHDLNSEPLLEVSEDLSIEDTLRDGIQIEYPNQISKFKTQNDNELNQNETTFVTEDAVEKLFLNFPKDLSEPMEITLPGGSFTVTHDAEQPYKAALLEYGSSNMEYGDDEFQNFKFQIPNSHEDQAKDEKTNYIRYTSEDGRKNIYYAYQKDQAEGYRNLKHWTLYNHGIGIESESYTFTNVTLKINDRGEVEGRFLTPFGNEQDSIHNTQDIDEGLWARAQRVIAQDQALNTPPDFIIPPPYYLDQYGRQTTLEWALNNNKDTISVAFNPLPGEYPVALDPTLQFTAPGVSNSGDVITGETTSTDFGGAVTTGDFNGDGKTDLAVGASGYDATTDDGRVYIFWSDTQPDDAVEADVIITGQGADDYFGYHLTSGDFNDDGQDDLVVGAYGYSSDTGRAYIFYSDGSFPTAAADADVIITGQGATHSFGYFFTTGDWNDDGKEDFATVSPGYVTGTGRVYVFYNDGSYPSAAADADVIYTGQGTYNIFGFALTSGDFNSDGTDDLAAGAYGYSAGNNTGRAYIFHGGSMSSSSAASADDIITGEGTGDYFAYFLTAGDLNDDGKDDLAVGAPGDATFTGKTYIFYGDGSIPTAAADADVIYTGEATNSYFGVSLSTGDLNGDGVDDLVSGAWVYSGYTGRAYVFHGGAMSSSTADTAETIITGEAAGDYFAYSLVTGDINNDGKDDLITGAPVYSSGAGRLYIFYSQSGQVNLNDHITGEGTSDYFGSAFAVGDFNSDGRQDLAVGEKDGGASAVGNVFIFYNDGDYTDLASTSDVVIAGVDSGGDFGFALSAGDFDNDGDDDLAVGAPQAASANGEVYIFYNDGSYPSTAATADVTITTVAANDSFGDALAAGDMDDDGDTDLVVGDYYYSAGLGAVYIFYNDGAYPGITTSADEEIAGEDWQLFGDEVAVGDVDGDGDDDLIVTENYSEKVHVYYNDGAYPSVASGADVLFTGENLSGFGLALAVGDLNTDGTDDIAIANSWFGGVYVYYGGSLASTTAANADVVIADDGSSESLGIAIGDYNNDGKDDLALGDYNYNTRTGRVHIFFNDGSYPTYASTSDITITGENTNDDFGYALISGDFNANGKNDLVIGAPGYGSNTGRIYFYETREDYAWEIQRQSLADGLRVDPLMGYEMKITGETTNNNFASAMVMADFNNDGKDDLAVGADNMNKVYIYYNTGDYPTRAGRADVILTGEGTADFGDKLAVGDLNADGTQDLVVGDPAYSLASGRAYIFYGGALSNKSAANADVVIQGESNSDWFGWSLATGDYNADGTDDLAVGARQYNSPQGRVYVFYGGALSTSLTAGTDDDVIYTGEADSYLGASVVSGDFNADGVDDLAMGGTNYNSGQGRTYLFYGGAMSSTTVDNANVIYTGEAASNYFGNTVTTGDYDRDGVDDLVVSATGYTSNTGRAYVFYGGAMASSSASAADVIYTGEATSDSFGQSLVSGDFDRDGRQDLAVGAYLYDVGAGTNEGRSYIFYSTTTPGSRNASAADIILTGESVGDNYGAAIFAGDLNNDGTDDLLVGATGYNSGQGRAYFYTTNDRHMTGQSADNFFGSDFAVADFNNDGKNDLAVGGYGWNGDNTGRVYLFYGGRKATTTADGADHTITGAASGDRFGFALTAGDINFDGQDDLVVGAYDATQGKVYVFYGDDSIPTTAGTADITITGGASGDNFGYSLAIGDYNKDGKDDIAVGATGYDTFQTGRAYLFYGDGSVPTTAGSADVTLTGAGIFAEFGTALETGDFNADGQDDLAASAAGSGYVYLFYSTSTPSSRSASAADANIQGGSYFGFALTAGDYNLDGRDDLAAGEHLYTSSTGRAYVFYGDGSFPAAAVSADAIITGENSFHRFGYTLSTGDLNADGRDDLIVGAYDWDDDQTGRAYVFYGEELRTVDAQFANTIITGETTSTWFGYALETGDLSGNGVDDLIVGAYGLSDPDVSNNNEGRVYIIMSEAAAEKRSHYRIRGNVQMRGNVQFR